MRNQELSKAMRLMGSRGGKRAAANMTKAQRVARARKASAAAATKRSKEARNV